MVRKCCNIIWINYGCCGDEAMWFRLRKKNKKEIEMEENAKSIIRWLDRTEHKMKRNGDYRGFIKKKK